MFIAALFTTAKMGKEPKCPVTEEQMRKIQQVYGMGNYSALGKKDLFLHIVTIWRDTEAE